jgi:hypothetical protein
MFDRSGKPLLCRSGRSGPPLAQKTRPQQLGQASSAETRGEASGTGEQGTEPLTAKRLYENPAILND